MNKRDPVRRVQVFHMFIFSTIKSQLKLSSVVALMLSFLRDGAMMVEIQERTGELEKGVVWRD